MILVSRGLFRLTFWQCLFTFFYFKLHFSIKTGNKWQITNSAQEGLVKSLPHGINILTLEKWGVNEILLRLENLNEMKTVKIESDFLKILHPQSFKECHIVNLVGQPMMTGINNAHRKSCKNITLVPLEIKTFLLSW